MSDTRLLQCLLPAQSKQAVEQLESRNATIVHIEHDKSHEPADEETQLTRHFVQKRHVDVRWGST